MYLSHESLDSLLSLPISSDGKEKGPIQTVLWLWYYCGCSWKLYQFFPRTFCEYPSSLGDVRLYAFCHYELQHTRKWALFPTNHMLLTNELGELPQNKLKQVLIEKGADEIAFSKLQQSHIARYCHCHALQPNITYSARNVTSNRLHVQLLLVYIAEPDMVVKW